MDPWPSQSTDETGPVGPFTEVPHEPALVDPTEHTAVDAGDVGAGGFDADAPSAQADTVATEPETRPAEGEADEGDAVDLDAIAADLSDVERAMERLEAATYWTDEVTGAPLDDAFLADHPTARRAGPPTPPPAS